MHQDREQKIKAVFNAGKAACVPSAHRLPTLLTEAQGHCPDHGSCICCLGVALADWKPGMSLEEHLPEDGIVERMRALYSKEKARKDAELAAKPKPGKLPGFDH
jgi:hypothetical protein